VHAGFCLPSGVSAAKTRSEANEHGRPDAEERVSPIGAPSYASTIEIGDDCWIAAGVKILCGVKIGSGCVIGAGSVVTKVCYRRLKAVLVVALAHATIDAHQSADRMHTAQRLVASTLPSDLREWHADLTVGHS
jgi:carbonic anhydrase/acetyltransferase-like protein (isoleucine patch superfamily)